MEEVSSLNNTFSKKVPCFVLLSDHDICFSSVFPSIILFHSHFHFSGGNVMGGSSKVRGGGYQRSNQNMNELSNERRRYEEYGYRGEGGDDDNDGYIDERTGQRMNSGGMGRGGRGGNSNFDRLMGRGGGGRSGDYDDYGDDEMMMMGGGRQRGGRMMSGGGGGRGGDEMMMGGDRQRGGRMMSGGGGRGGDDYDRFDDFDDYGGGRGGSGGGRGGLLRDQQRN